GIALLGVAVAPGERGRSVQIGWSDRVGQKLHAEVVGVGLLVTVELSVVVDEVHVLNGLAVDTAGIDPVQLRLGMNAAEIVDRIVGIPQDLDAGVGILRIDVGEREAEDEWRLLAGGLIGDSAVLVDGELVG